MTDIETLRDFGYQLVVPTFINDFEHIHLLEGALQHDKVSSRVDNFVTEILPFVTEDQLYNYLLADVNSQSSNRYYVPEELRQVTVPYLSALSVDNLFRAALKRPYIKNSDGTLNADNTDYLEVLLPDVTPALRQNALSTYIREGDPTVEGIKVLLEWVSDDDIANALGEFTERVDSHSIDETQIEGIGQLLTGDDADSGEDVDEEEDEEED